jgi:hypothetical protein
MAIQTKMTFPNGIELPEAYIKVSSVTLKSGSDMKDFRVGINVDVYRDKEARESSLIPVVSEYITLLEGEFEEFFAYSVLDEQGKNVISQAYAYLKTLSQYENSIDV